MQFNDWRTRPAQNRVIVVPSKEPFLRVLRRPISDCSKGVRCSVQVVFLNKHIQIRRWSHALIRVKPFTKYGAFEANSLNTSLIHYAQHILESRLNVGLPHVPNDQPAFGTFSQLTGKTDSSGCQTMVEVALHTVKKGRTEDIVPFLDLGT